MKNSKKVLVTGASGKTGHRVSQQLRDRGYNVVEASRNAKGENGVKFDWLDESTFDEVLAKNIDSAYLLAPSGILDLLPAMKPFIDRLIKADIRIVLLSASSLEKDGAMMGAVHGYLEQNASKWVVLRPTWFMQNFSEQQHVQSICDEKAIYSATKDGKVGFISADDIATVAAVALIDTSIENGDYIITGPEAISYDQVAQIISEVTKNKVVHHKLSVDDLVKRHESQGLPLEYAQVLSAMDDDISKGSESKLTDNVEKITGKKPIDFRSFVKGAIGAWF